ncbi:MAG: formate/nitrite transporter family protein [Tissierellia bacterium]|nr:formate/nitrite transporter family protein [Tissierellia bacterium]
MYLKFIEVISQGALKKKNLYESSFAKYFVASMIAGLFIGVGMLTMAVSNYVFSPIEFPVVKFINGFVFSLALSLVIMAGGELFTGNVMVFSMGAFHGDVKWSDFGKLCLISYVGNLFGALFLSLIFMGTGAAGEAVGKSLVDISMAKASQPLQILFFKGILCNVMVCLGVLICNGMNTESGKLIMVFWCIMPFVVLGFEHCVANMTCFLFAKLTTSTFTFGHMLHNLVPVTLGNIVGGLIVTVSYYFVGKEK